MFNRIRQRSWLCSDSICGVTLESFFGRSCKCFFNRRSSFNFKDVRTKSPIYPVSLRGDNQISIAEKDNFKAIIVRIDDVLQITCY